MWLALNTSLVCQDMIFIVADPFEVGITNDKPCCPRYECSHGAMLYMDLHVAP